MKNSRSLVALLLIFIIGAVALIGCAVNGGKSGEQPSLQLVDTNKLTGMIKKKEDMTIVDLREPELFTAGRVPGSINIPFAEIQSRYKELPKEKKIVFVCHTGRMGTESGNLLLQNGFKQVFNLEGGMAKWTGEMEK